VQRFEVEYVQVLDTEGHVDTAQMPDLNDDQIKQIYHVMRLTREMDRRLFKLQRQGKIGTFVEARGEEASEVASAYALRPADWMVPSFRESGAYLMRGADRVKFIQSWKGDTRGFIGDEHCRDLPVSIPIASQIPHAVGLAWAEKIKGKKNVALVYFGDGATSEGDFHEALNFAGVLKLPVIFFCQNNQWAISTPRSKQTASATIAQKAIAYGMPGIQVDGNDALAVYKVTREAIGRARDGGGPTLIESLTYRLGDHTTSDDASRYRSEEEVQSWQAKEPIARLEHYFREKGTWTDDYGTWVGHEVAKEVDEAIEKAMAIPPPPPENLFNNVYAKIPPVLVEEKAELEKEWKAIKAEREAKKEGAP